MRPIARIAAIVVAALAAYGLPTDALACKDRKYPKTFPVEELALYESVYVVRIISVKLDRPLAEGWYTPPFSFQAIILRTLKGLDSPGATISGETSFGEEAAARCPVQLKSGTDYLVMLNGKGNPYVLPRYGTLYLGSDDGHFNEYIADITRFYGRDASR